ncbi:hypothetical protein V8F20_008393 [Naviculisporaceae sp. PSN 640]
MIQHSTHQTKRSKREPLETSEQQHVKKKQDADDIYVPCSAEASTPHTSGEHDAEDDRKNKSGKEEGRERRLSSTGTPPLPEKGFPWGRGRSDNLDNYASKVEVAKEQGSGGEGLKGRRQAKALNDHRSTHPQKGRMNKDRNNVDGQDLGRAYNRRDERICGHSQVTTDAGPAGLAQWSTVRNNLSTKQFCRQNAVCLRCLPTTGQSSAVRQASKASQTKGASAPLLSRGRDGEADELKPAGRPATHRHSSPALSSFLSIFALYGVHMWVLCLSRLASKGSSPSFSPRTWTSLPWVDDMAEGAGWSAGSRPECRAEIVRQSSWIAPSSTGESQIPLWLTSVLYIWGGVGEGAQCSAVANGDHSRGETNRKLLHDSNHLARDFKPRVFSRSAVCSGSGSPYLGVRMGKVRGGWLS